MLQKFFNPKTIAIIGASANPEKLGNVIVKNLTEHKYRGKIFPINPNENKILGKKVYRSVIDIPVPVDLAMIVVPASVVPFVLRECGHKKIRAAVIISAGFGELGVDGKKREKQLLRIASQYNIHILGPNCLGLIIPRLRMNASFAEGLPDKGSVAVISQSGAMAVAITDWALSSGLGFSALISLGNKADIHEESLLSYFGRDPDTKVVVMYLESLATGRSLLRVIKRVSARTPVIILKPGKSMRARQAVASHTGALAGSHEVQNAALEAAGALVVTSLEDLFMYTSLFETPRTIQGGNIAILTNAGGPGILATDETDTAPNLSLATLEDTTIQQLQKELPSAAALKNPVDVVGDASASRYKKALQILAKDQSVNAIVAVVTHQYVTETDKIARAIIAVQRMHKDIPIVASFVGGTSVQSAREILIKADMLHFAFPERAVRALSVLRKYHTEKDSRQNFPDIEAITKGRITAVLGKKAERLIQKYVPGIIPSALVRTEDEAVTKAKRLGYPLVAKIVGQKYLHKTDHGAVKLNITSEEELRSLIVAWRKKFGTRFKKDEGYLLQQFVPGVIEIVIGAKRDPVIGPYMILGIGGVFVESLRSTTIVPLPITKVHAEKLLHKELLGRILNSQRGSTVPRKMIIEIILGVSKVMETKKDIVEFELNPVICASNRVDVVDIRILRIKK